MYAAIKKARLLEKRFPVEEPETLTDEELDGSFGKMNAPFGR